MKIIYMGTPDFAVPCLERLITDGYDVCLVVTQPDKPQGRKMILTPSPVKEIALKYNIEVYQPSTLKSDEALRKIQYYNADFIVVAAYGNILPKAVLDSPKYACINVHGSLLPEYRGAAPIQRAVIDGKKTSGITIMLMDTGLDTGDMLMKYETEIGENETSGELFERLALKAPDLLIQTLKKYANNELKTLKQDNEKSTYASMLNKTEAVINWQESMQINHNKIRGMNPWPIATTVIEGKKLKIYNSLKTDKSSNKPYGTVIIDKDGIFVVCGDGLLLQLTELQIEGGKRMDWCSFSVGHRDIDGKIIG